MDGYLLDTCAVCGWYRQNPLITARADALPQDAPLYVSAITLGEIACGHAGEGSTDPEKRREFMRWLDETFGPNELAVTGSTAEPYGILRARLFKKFGDKKRPEQCMDASGHSMGVDENDLWLAAQAIEHELELITADQMNRIREVVENDLVVTVWPVS